MIQGMRDKVEAAEAAKVAAIREHKELGERLEREYQEKDRRLKDSLRKQMDKLIDEQMAEI